MFKNDTISSDALEEMTKFTDKIAERLYVKLAEYAHCRLNVPNEQGVNIELEDVLSFQKEFLSQIDGFLENF